MFTKLLSSAALTAAALLMLSSTAQATAILPMELITDGKSSAFYHAW